MGVAVSTCSAIAPSPAPSSVTSPRLSSAPQGRYRLGISTQIVHCAHMPSSDRAFRALARAQPDVIAGLLAALAPGLLPEGAIPLPDDVVPTQIDALPAELDADFAARIDDRDLLHVECQGYRDTGFEARTLWYHVGFALRHRGRRRVRTVAIWLTRPPRNHPEPG